MRLPTHPLFPSLRSAPSSASPAMVSACRAHTAMVFLAWAYGLLVLWLLALWAGPAALEALGLVLNPHGHQTLYAHGHPFVDARVLWGMPNAMDVLSNLPFVVAGGWGLAALHRRAVPSVTRAALGVFFTGLVLTGFGSAGYHGAPDALGLVGDRAGMAVTFAGALSLVVAERVGQAYARATLWVTVVLALVAAALPLVAGNVLPWAVVQFGGVALIVWAAMQRPAAGAMGVHVGSLIGCYAVAKVLELGDDAVFHVTSALVSGHSLKHVAAALAAWPVLFALHRCEPATGLGQNPVRTGAARV